MMQAQAKQAEVEHPALCVGAFLFTELFFPGDFHKVRGAGFEPWVTTTMARLSAALRRDRPLATSHVSGGRSNRAELSALVKQS